MFACFTYKLGRKFFGVRSCNCAADNRVVSVEVLRDLLERSVAGFDVEEVHHSQFDLIFFIIMSAPEKALL